MQCTRITELGCKEVINICDGARYGYVNDVEIDTLTGEVTSVIVPQKWKFTCLFARREEYVIPWCNIRRIGEDIILVDHQLEKGTQREKRTWFAK